MKNPFIRISCFVVILNFVCCSDLFCQDLYHKSLTLNGDNPNANHTDLLNYWSSINFEDISEESIRTKESLDNISVFLVFKTPLENEKILSVENKNLFLGQGSVSGFEDAFLSTSNFPKLITYKESVKFGNRTTNKIIPSKNSTVYESIVFPDVIAKFKREIIETYLGLKYSITLNSHYISSKRDTVYNIEKNKGFISNIFGLGRDDGSLLYQKQSMDYSGIVQIGLNKIKETNNKNQSTINDSEYFILADNGAESGGERKDGFFVPNKLWKGSFIGKDLKYENYEFIVDVKKLFDKELDAKTYWLVLSSDSGNSIDFMQSEFVLGEMIENNEEVLIDFNSFDLPIANDSFLFTVVSSDEEFLVLHEIQKENCQEAGVIKVKVKGEGESYAIALINEYGETIVSKEGKDVFFNEVEEGNYKLEVTDLKTQRKVLKSISINSTTRNQKFEEYVDFSNNHNELIPADTYILNSSNQFWWEKSGSKVSDELYFQPKEEGLYILYELDDKGCLYTYHFTVYDKIRRDNNLLIDNSWAGIYPNPVKARSEFTIQLKLPDTSDVVLSILTMDGSLILQERIPQKRSFIYKNKLSQTGTYNIVVETKDKVYNYKLIVN